MNSYDLNGKKQSFANWISMLRTYETPFLNLVKTEKVDHALFSWQVDSLKAPADEAFIEGSDAVSKTLSPTRVMQNVTQILSKVVKVSDTAAAIESWGRKKETAYQMEKAGLELFKDLEWAFLNNTVMEPGNNNKPRITAGVRGLASGINVSDPVTGAITHKVTDKDITEDDLFDLTYSLYLAGSKANLICYHPSMAIFFSSLLEGSSKARIFKNNPKIMLEVFTIVDPLGQRYALMPLRQMPKDVIYILNKDDFTQKILRSPSRVLLARDGSYDKWLLEIEIGLRLSNPNAVGILQRIGDSNSLLMGSRMKNAISVQNNPTAEEHFAVDFVASEGVWSPPTTEYDVVIPVDSNLLNIYVTSAVTRPDKLNLKVYEITAGNPDYLVMNNFFDSDMQRSEIAMAPTFVVPGRKYRIECEGYVDGQFVKQVLGTINLVAPPLTP